MLSIVHETYYELKIHFKQFAILLSEWDNLMEIINTDSFDSNFHKVSYDLDREKLKKIHFNGPIALPKVFFSGSQYRLDFESG